jgi:hypothetical protein
MAAVQRIESDVQEPDPAERERLLRLVQDPAVVPHWALMTGLGLYCLVCWVGLALAGAWALGGFNDFLAR